MDNETLWEKVAELEAEMIQKNLSQERKLKLREEASRLKMQTNDLRHPADWSIFEGIIIMDPDGWDRKNFDVSWNTPINYAEWQERMTQSTIRMKPYADRTLF